MARARGSSALMALAFESTYATSPGSGYFQLPFVSSQLGAEQGLIPNDLLGQGREPLDPALDVVNNDGDVVIPVDLRAFGYWLKLLLGGASTGATTHATGKLTFSAQPADASTITLNGVVWTFVSGVASGNETQIQGSLAATLTQLATDLNASAVGGVTPATYSSTATELDISYDAAGPGGNAYTLAAGAGSNGTPSGATLTGGGNGHTFNTGALTLPSASIEIGFPEVPSFGMNYGCRADKIKIALARSGHLNATASLVAKGELKASVTGAGTPTSIVVERFTQFSGQIKKNGVQLADIVSAEITIANNLDKVAVIRPDGEIEDSDPGLVAVTGSIVSRFADTSLLDQATAHGACSLDFGWSIATGKALDFTVNRVFLPRAKTPVTGPGGIQATFNWQAARDLGTGITASALLTNDVSGYA